MKYLALAVMLVSGVAGFGACADAQNYPWCAVLNMGEWASNCGFITEEQCRTSVSGIGGFCMRNTTYVPPPAPTPRQRRHRGTHS